MGMRQDLRIVAILTFIALTLKMQEYGVDIMVSIRNFPEMNGVETSNKVVVFLMTIYSFT